MGWHASVICMNDIYCRELPVMSPSFMRRGAQPASLCALCYLQKHNSRAAFAPLRETSQRALCSFAR